MKRSFLLLVLALSFSALFAQQTTVALLNHEGTISTFYGTEALVQAHKAAVHGDVITLSGGAFAAPSSWVKAVTLRGAGCYEGADNSREVTYINTSFKLAIPDDVQTALTIEGISFKSTCTFSTSVKNTTFLKSSFEGAVYSVRGNANFYNCILAKSLGLYNNGGSTDTNANFFNCYVSNPDYENYNYLDGAHAIFTNCVLHFSSTNYYQNNISPYRFGYVKYYNCIFIGNIKSTSIEPSEFNIPVASTANNCLSCYCVYTPAVDTDTETKDAVYDYNIFDNMGSAQNYYLEEGKPINETISSVFKTYNGTNNFSFNELYELTDEAKAMYIGADGTQVGLYGGIGFDLVPSILQITKCEVAPRSTTDGKLSVKIEVGIPE